MNNEQYTKIKTEGVPFDSLIKEATETHGVSYGLLHKQLFIESSFNPKAVSPTGARQHSAEHDGITRMMRCTQSQSLSG